MGFCVCVHAYIFMDVDVCKHIQKRNIIHEILTLMM